MILLLASFGCQNLDEAPDASASKAAARTDEGYPSLHSVPPRPQLSYPVRQQRAIVGELLADRSNARYTEQVIRYRTGLSALPPPPEPPATATQPAVEAVIAEAAPVEPEGTQPEPMAQQPPPRNIADYDSGDLDDGGLDDMIEGMVVDTDDARAASPPAEADLAPSAGPTAEPARPSRTPPQEMEGEEGVVNRLFDWLGGLVDGEDQATATHNRSPDEPDTRRLAAADAQAAADPVEPEGTADEHPIEPAAGEATAELAPDAQETAGPPPRDAPRPESAPAVVPAVRPAPEASTITVASTGVEISPAEPAADPDPTVVAFAPGSAALPRQALAKLASFMAEVSADGARITVLGEGSPPALAIDRARAVGQALVRLGASADRLRMAAAETGAGDRARLVVTEPGGG